LFFLCATYDADLSGHQRLERPVLGDRSSHPGKATRSANACPVTRLVSVTNSSLVGLSPT
jgi:hypothetical protein